MIDFLVTVPENSLTRIKEAFSVKGESLEEVKENVEKELKLYIKRKVLNYEAKKAYKDFRKTNSFTEQPED